MDAQERIIRNALDAARLHGNSGGDGGKAMAKIYREDAAIGVLTLLTMIAIMANGLAELEQPTA